MRVPTIFQGKMCKCGNLIEDQSVKEIGIDFNTEQFVLRFTCSKCGLNGKLRFKTENKKIEDLCSEIISVAEASKALNKESEKNSKTFEDIFSSDFDQNKIACLFIPKWTDESMSNFLDSLS